MKQTLNTLDAYFVNDQHWKPEVCKGSHKLFTYNARYYKLSESFLLAKAVKPHEVRQQAD